MLLILLALGMVFFAFCYLEEAGTFRLKRMKIFNAQIIDEVEDEIFDNTGNTKVRFFKAYEFEEDGEKKVVRSERPMRRITDTVGKKCEIFVDSKNRKAMEKGDVIRYRIYAVLLIVLALLIAGAVIYLEVCVPEANLL